LESLSIWKSTFEALPLVDTAIWTVNFSNWLDARMTANADLSTLTNPAQTYTFAKSTFDTELQALVLELSRSNAATNFAAAWRAAIDASTTLNVVAGASIPPGTLPFTWSVVSSAVIDAASKDAAETALRDGIIAIPNVSDITNSQLPDELRAAALTLTGTVTGLDSQIPTPQPLVAAALPFI